MKNLFPLFFLCVWLPGLLLASQIPQVAGSFYPSNSQALEKQVNQFLEGESPQGEFSPRILIVPHAGYDYSGAVAGTGFGRLQGSGISVVIILGVAHQYPARIDGAALDPKGTFETPLGKIEIEEATSARLLTLSKKIQNHPGAFTGEHSVEVELPFLQKVLPGFKLVPMVMNVPDLENAREVGEAIAQMMRENERVGKKTLLVVSSDFSHYPQQADAETSDRAMLKAIEAVDPDALFNASREMRRKGIPELFTTMCGEAGILTGLYAAKALGISTGKILRHATSADVPLGDSARVVGYAAIAFYRGLGEGEKKILLQHAHDSVRAYLESKTILKKTATDSAELEIPRAVFVTLRKKGQLRGCVGGTEPVWPLAEAVAYYARAAAFEDSRFSPVTLDELKTLSFEISILSSRQKVSGPEAIKPGRDGVLLIKGEHSGLFLPQVWKETGWNKETFLKELASQKAGLSPDAWRDPETELFTFTVDTFQEK